MNQTITIGEKISKPYILFMSFFFLCGTLLMDGFLLWVIFPLFTKTISPAFIVCLIILSLIFSVFFYIPLIAKNERIEVTEKTITYYECSSHLKCLADILAILKNKPCQPTLSFKTDDVAQLKLSYAFPHASTLIHGRCLVMLFLMKDGTLIQIDHELIVNGSADSLQAVLFLEQKGIRIVDPFGLRQALGKSGAEFTAYIVALEKENHHD